MYECSKECPECGGIVKWDYACHTYPSDRDGKVTWMACMPCDSATRYVCQAHNEERCDSDCMEWDEHEGCGWTWTWGLNPNNPRAADNETRNPRWGEDEM
jgi:hypothetical protein